MIGYKKGGDQYVPHFYNFLLSVIMKYALRFISLLFLCSLVACTGAETENSYPKAPDDVRRERHGTLTGDGSLFQLGGGRKEGSGGTGSSIGVNGYLWRASLDTISFMPLVSADPFGGVIITDWYADPKTPNERFKLNVFILGGSLRADGVKVTAFKQLLDVRNGWQDAPISGNISRELEDKILTRARQLRVNRAAG